MSLALAFLLLISPLLLLAMSPKMRWFTVTCVTRPTSMFRRVVVFVIPVILIRCGRAGSMRIVAGFVAPAVRTELVEVQVEPIQRGLR